jgi:hypothetical protein
VRATGFLLVIGLLSAGVAVGCRNTPPPRVPVPSSSGGNPYTTYDHDPVKPLPPSATQALRETQETQALRESARPAGGGAPPAMVEIAPPGLPVVSAAYLDAYDRVGRPRILVTVVRGDHPERALVPGDYDLLERIIRDVISGGGQVAVVPANFVRDRLSASQVADLQSGESKSLKEIGAVLRADVLVEVKIGAAGDQTQLTATAKNTRDAQPIASAAATIPSLSPRRQIDFAGRLLGERTVDALADTWDRFAKDLAARPATQPAQPAR